MSKSVYTALAFYLPNKLLLIITLVFLVSYTGKVLLGNVYGQAPIHKTITTPLNSNEDQDDSDSKEEVKFAEKQPITTLLSPVEFTAVWATYKALFPHLYQPKFLKTYYLPVLTPPPNC